jgi:CrcB protein
VSAARVDRKELAAIFAGGCIGVLIRAGLTEWADTPPGHWPWATFAVNMAAAFALGYFVSRPHGLDRSTYLPALIGPGLCGALSTFSTMQVELLQMLDAGDVGLAVAYLAVSVAAGFSAVRLARTVVRRTGATA